MAEPMDIDTELQNQLMASHSQQMSNSHAASPSRCPYRSSTTGNSMASENQYQNMPFHQQPQLPPYGSLPFAEHISPSPHLPGISNFPSNNFRYPMPPALQPPFGAIFHQNTYITNFNESGNQPSRAGETSSFDNNFMHFRPQFPPRLGLSPYQHQMPENRRVILPRPSIPNNGHSNTVNFGGTVANLGPASTSSGSPPARNMPWSDAMQTQSRSRESEISNLRHTETDQSASAPRPQLPHMSSDPFHMQDRLPMPPLRSFSGFEHPRVSSSGINDEAATGAHHSSPPRHTLPPPESQRSPSSPERTQSGTPPSALASLDRANRVLATPVTSFASDQNPSRSRQGRFQTELELAAHTRLFMEDSSDEEDENATHHANWLMPMANGSTRAAYSELDIERLRAARRAQMAAVKYVASQAAIASFERVDIDTLGEDQRSCIICYNDFGVMNPDGHIECPVRLPKCKHVFGDHCIKQWLKDSDSCPYCRDKLPSEPKRDSRFVRSGIEALSSRSQQFLLGMARNGHSIQGARSNQAHSRPHDDADDEIIRAMMSQEIHLTNEERLRMLEHWHRRRHPLTDHTRSTATSDNTTNQGSSRNGALDSDGTRHSRRANRHRQHIGTQHPSQPSGPPSSLPTDGARSGVGTSQSLQPSTRSHIQNQNSSLSEGSTSQQRSITPHPSTWSQQRSSYLPSGYPRVTPTVRSHGMNPETFASSSIPSETMLRPNSVTDWGPASTLVAPPHSRAMMPHMNYPMRRGFIDSSPSQRAVGRPRSLEYHFDSPSEAHIDRNRSPFEFYGYMPVPDAAQEASDTPEPQVQMPPRFTQRTSYPNQAFSTMYSQQGDFQFFGSDPGQASGQAQNSYPPGMIPGR